MNTHPETGNLLDHSAIPDHDVVSEYDRRLIGISLLLGTSFRSTWGTSLLSSGKVSWSAALPAPSAKGPPDGPAWPTLLSAGPAWPLALLHHAPPRSHIEPAKLHDSITTIGQNVICPDVARPAVVEDDRLGGAIHNVIGDPDVTGNVVEINSDPVVAVGILMGVSDIVHPVVDHTVAQSLVSREIDPGKVADDALPLLVYVIVGNRVVVWEWTTGGGGHANANPSAVKIIDFVVGDRIVRRVADPDAGPDSCRKNAPS